MQNPFRHVTEKHRITIFEAMNKNKARLVSSVFDHGRKMQKEEKLPPKDR